MPGRGSIITAIDVGTRKVCTVIARWSGSDEFAIIGVGISRSEGMRKGLVVDLDAVTSSVERSVTKAERMAEVGVDSAFVGVTGSNIASTGTTGMAIVQEPRRGISRDDISRSIEASKIVMLPPEKEVLDVIVQEFIVDGHGGIADPLGMSGTRLETRVQLVTAASSFLQNIARCITRLDIKLNGLILEPFASGEAVLSDDEKQIGTLLLDIGGGTTDIAVFRNGSLSMARILPVGGDNIDYDVAVGLSTSVQEAERIKIECGRAYLSGTDESVPIEIQPVGKEEKIQVPKGLLCEVIQPRVTEMLNLVVREVEEADPGEAVPGGVVLTGGGALLEGMSEMVGRVFDAHVRVGTPRYGGRCSELVSSPIFATGVGLLRCAVGHMQSAWRNGASQERGLRRWVKDFVGFFREI